MDFVFNYVKAQGAKKVSIGIVDENSVLKNWYKLYGFIETGLKQYEHLPFAVCFMEKLVERIVWEVAVRRRLWLYRFIINRRGFSIDMPKDFWNSRKGSIVSSSKIVLLGINEIVNDIPFIDILIEDNVDYRSLSVFRDELQKLTNKHIGQDLEAKRFSEVDLFSGTVLELGKKYNVSTPVNEGLYRRIKAIEAQY